MRKGPLSFDVTILRKLRQVKIAARKPGNSFVGFIRSTFFCRHTLFKPSSKMKN